MGAVVFYGNGSVWDAEKHEVLCRFVDGKYETKDAREIGILSASFPHDASEVKPEAKPEPQPRGRKVKYG